MKNLFLIAAALVFLSSVSYAQVYNDATLARVISEDNSVKDAGGNLPLLPIGQHMYRADVYMSNRQFPSARRHWQKVLENYPTDALVPKALFGMGRSNMWERNYEEAVSWFDKLVKNHLSDEWGQEGLAYKGASLVRLGKNLEAAAAYEQYATMFPFGKRIESSFLNIIDAYREAGEFEKAIEWVIKTRKRFNGMATETNALHGQLRMEVFRKNWYAVIATANELLRLKNFANSMAFEYEVMFLKAFAHEQLDQKPQAISAYTSIPANATSYFGSLATDRIAALGGNVTYRNEQMQRESRSIAGQFPVKYRSEIIQFAKSRGIDPRFILAIMKQESSFQAGAKSPAAARGLLQLTFDTALKYNKEAGFPTINANDLYRPNINVAIGSVYIKELKDRFGGLYEAIAASYNGGEDNAERWLARSEPKTAAIFASEVGFSETKKYVFKVMSNYRIYQELYDENLVRK